jgi:hypothetical protein
MQLAKSYLRYVALALSSLIEPQLRQAGGESLLGENSHRPLWRLTMPHVPSLAGRHDLIRAAPGFRLGNRSYLLCGGRHLCQKKAASGFFPVAPYSTSAQPPFRQLRLEQYPRFTRLALPACVMPGAYQPSPASIAIPRLPHVPIVTCTPAATPGQADRERQGEPALELHSATPQKPAGVRVWGVGMVSQTA